MELDVKTYYPSRDYKKGLIPSQQQKRQGMEEQIREGMRNLEVTLRDLKETEQSQKGKMIIEMAEEWIEIIQKGCGTKLQRLTHKDDERIEDMYRMTKKLIKELEELKPKKEKSFADD